MAESLLNGICGRILVAVCAGCAAGAGRCGAGAAPALSLVGSSPSPRSVSHLQGLEHLTGPAHSSAPSGC